MGDQVARLAARGIERVKRIKFLLVAIVVIVGSLVLAACDRPDGVVEGTVSGVDPDAMEVQVVIYELQRADEVPGVNVFQKGAILQRTVVDENGGFAFTLPPEEYILQVWLNGIEVRDQMIEVKSGRTTTLDLEVTPPSS